MTVIRELLNLDQSAPGVESVLLSDMETGSERRFDVQTTGICGTERGLCPGPRRLEGDSALRARIDKLRADLDQGAIAHVYTDYSTVRGLCVLKQHQREEVGDQGAGIGDTRHPTPGLRSEIRVLCGMKHFEITSLLADGDESERIRIKLALAREALFDICPQPRSPTNDARDSYFGEPTSPWECRVVAQLPANDRSGISALRQCGFQLVPSSRFLVAPGGAAKREPGTKNQERGTRMDDEQAWENLLSSEGCTLYRESANPKAEIRSPNSSFGFRHSDSRFRVVTLVRDLGSKSEIRNPKSKISGPDTRPQTPGTHPKGA